MLFQFIRKKILLLIFLILFFFVYKILFMVANLVAEIVYKVRFCRSQLLFRSYLVAWSSSKHDVSTTKNAKNAGSISFLIHHPSMIIINWIGNHITLTADMSRPSFKTENIQIAPELSTLQKRTSTKKIYHLLTTTATSVTAARKIII